MPCAFTKHSVLMLSKVLSSKITIQVNIRITKVSVGKNEVLSAFQALIAKIDR